MGTPTSEDLGDLDGVRLLLTALETAWSRGWQPADLVRLHARRADRLAGDLLRALVGRQLATYPAGTLDPRWRAQLRELGIRVASGWAVRETMLAAGPRLGEVLASLLDFLRWLPRIELLTPLPGSAADHDAASIPRRGRSCPGN